MKRIRVTVIDEYLIPDDWEVTKHPSGGLVCLQGDDKYFTPAIEWGEKAPPPAKHWATVDENRGNWFFAHLEQADAKIREIK